MKFLFRSEYYVLLASVLLVIMLGVAQAASINGVYLRKNKEAVSHLRVFDCGGGKGIEVIKSSHKPSVGKRIMCGAKAKGKGWSGKILNLEDGKHYSATISNSGSKLKIRGCILGGVLCENQFLPIVK